MSKLLNEVNELGVRVAGRLAALKEGKDIRLEFLSNAEALGGDWGKRETERHLREWLERISAARKRIAVGEHHICARCANEIESALRAEDILSVWCRRCSKENENG